MSILTIRNLTQAYGDFELFVGLNAAIPNDGKIGLVGPNGIGKTSLLRILVGLDTPSAGDVYTARETRLGYLRQEAMEAFIERDNTVYAEMLTVFAELKTKEAELRTLEQRMADEVHTDALLTEYSTTIEQFERAGGYDYELRISQTLQGLGFGKDDWEAPLSRLSGGQKTRALLARLLLERPDLLVLDEPTNHLDVEAIEWLENTLASWDGALLIVSHDRYFLDRVVNRIWEMSRTGLEEYRGNYSAYVQQRQERWALREAEYEAIREKFLKELDYVKRNIARDATTNMAKGRLRRLIREVRVVEAGGLHALNNMNWGRVMEEVDISESRWGVMDVEQAIKALRSPIVRPPDLTLHLKPTMRSGNIVLRTTELEIGFPGNPLFRADPIELHRTECAALIGPNGTGKTTFLRTLMEQLTPLSGVMRFGASLKIGYFAQSQDRLNPENTVLDELLSHKHMLLGPARNYLAQYLFRGEDVFKRISMLSGGERARLALAILALDGANFLLLDEPTNHLDIPAQEVLQEVLEHFDGTILLVSHDRYLIDRLASQIWNLDEGMLTVFAGSYQAFLAERVGRQAEVKLQVEEQRGGTWDVRKVERARKNEERKRQQKAAEWEEKVHQLEKQLSRLEQDLTTASQEQDRTKLQQLSEAYSRTQTDLDQAMETWAELADG